MNKSAKARNHDKKVISVFLALGLVSSAMLALVTTGALSGFTASINNTVNTAGSGTLLMTETQGATTCLSSAAGTVTTANAGTCATINKFGGNTAMAPNVPVTSTITIKNDGTAPATSFSLTPGGCNVSNNGTVNGTGSATFCSVMDLTIQDDTTNTCVFPAAATACAAPSSSATLTTLGTSAITLATPLAPGASRSYTFTIKIDPAATNAHQGLLASETLLWSFAA